MTGRRTHEQPHHLRNHDVLVGGVLDMRRQHRPPLGDAMNWVYVFIGVMLTLMTLRSCMT